MTGRLWTTGTGAVAADGSINHDRHLIDDNPEYGAWHSRPMGRGGFLTGLAA